MRRCESAETRMAREEGTLKSISDVARQVQGPFASKLADRFAHFIRRSGERGARRDVKNDK